VPVTDEMLWKPNPANWLSWRRTLDSSGFSPLDQIYAVNVQTGQLAWETPVMDPKKRARASSGPIIANGKVITGRQCQPDAGNDACIVTAHDAKTGKEVWSTRTIPRQGDQARSYLPR
jgi:alcohol dehydrogenase (cytochrome c)